MKKILIISPCGTHPPTEGNRQRVLSLAEALTDAGHQVHLALLPNNKFEGGEPDAMRDYWGDRLHSLYPFHRWTPGFRLRRMAARPLSAVLRRLLGAPAPVDGIPSIDTMYYDWWDAQLMLLQLRQRFDVVFAEYVFVSRALANFPAAVRRIVDTHDIFSGRDDALRNSRNIASDWLSTDPVSEGRALDRADAVLGIQDEESEQLRRLTHRPVVTVGHFIAPVAGTAADADGPASRILFVGSANAINVDGCAWFLDQVMAPVAGAVPGLCLRIVGGAGPALAQRYGADPRLEVAGQVATLDSEYAAADVVINPVQFGTGLAIKSIEALAHGAALLCTPEGARGIRLGDDDAPPCAVATGAADFAAQLIDLLTDPARRARQRRAARTFVQAWNQRQADNLAAVLQP